MQNIKIIEDAYKACRASVIAVATFSGVANLLMLVPAFFMLNVYDKAVGNNSLPTLWVLSGITVFMFLVLGIMEALRAKVLVSISGRIDQILSPALYRQTFQYAALEGKAAPSVQPLQDLHGLRQFLTGTGIFAVFDAPWLPVYLLVMFLFHPMLGWLGVVSVLALLCVAILNQSRTSGPMAAANELHRGTTAETLKGLRNAEAALAMGMMPALAQQWREKQDQMLDAHSLASNIGATFSAITKTLRLAVQSAAIALGAYLVLRQEISPGMLIAGSILIGRALQPVEIAVGAWNGFLNAKQQYDGLKLLLSQVQEETVNLELPPIVGSVTAKQLAVAPPGEKRATLYDVSLSIPAGSTTMVLGPSGAGKSTFVRAVLGLWPSAAGELRIDGSEAHKFDRAVLGPQVGYLPQDIELLDGSVADNIARFDEYEASDVIEAATNAGVHDFILSLPNGYDTVLGGGLSPGQRQRVALARALYRYPKLIVLDEPNSNLDDAGEAALADAIGRMKQAGSTVIVVSHRSNIIPLADHILIMGAGRVVEFGPASEVLQKHAKSSAPKPHRKNTSTAVQGPRTVLPPRLPKI